ncbi:MAG: signal peptidase II, partial [Balneolaceae bacterium]
IVLILDQITKYIVRTNMSLHRLEVIEGWLAFNFTKNPGMALGMDWLSTQTISIIAILATIGIISYILYSLKKASFAYLFCMGLIVGGALGNIADRLFMGLVGGYGGVLHGHVVDFIHFTLRIGDRAVFPYIFNVADIAISTSIIILLLFHRKIMPAEAEPELHEQEEEGVGKMDPMGEHSKLNESELHKPASGGHHSGNQDSIKSEKDSL